MIEQDEEIIKKIVEGDPDAYHILVERYAKQILNLCFRYLNSREEAEDAVQDVFLKAYEALPGWEPKALFKTWLYRIAINHSLNLKRRQKKITFQTFDDFAEQKEKLHDMTPGAIGHNAESRLIVEQRNKVIQYAVGRLPENQRQVIVLYYYQNLSYKEMADILETSISSIESRLFRAKKKLAKLLSG